MSRQLLHLDATAAVQGIKAGDINPADLVKACIRQIHERDPGLQAWETFNDEFVLSQLAGLDRNAEQGPLYGIPIGIKDIIATKGMLTTSGSPIFADHVPEEDALCVKKLKQAGAIIMGKTVTTEFAYLSPGKTRNPHNADHTPGGSSSGSAAAVADFHIPLALGSQTAGSIIRPASYCGVVGYKPTFDHFSFNGVQHFAPSFDTLGGFARSVRDIVLLRSVLAEENENAAIKPGLPAGIACVRGPYWTEVLPETRNIIDSASKLFSRHGITVEDIQLPGIFNNLNEAHRTVMLSECSETLSELYTSNKEKFSDLLRRDYEYGASINSEQVAAARTVINTCAEEIRTIYAQHELVLAAASPGAAPAGLEKTGDPVFNRIWTAMGLPCISLHANKNSNAMPVGVQLVGARDRDSKLLSQAAALEVLLDEAG